MYFVHTILILSHLPKPLLPQLRSLNNVYHSEMMMKMGLTMLTMMECFGTTLQLVLMKGHWTNPTHHSSFRSTNSFCFAKVQIKYNNTAKQCCSNGRQSSARFDFDVFSILCKFRSLFSEEYSTYYYLLFSQ